MRLYTFLNFKVVSLCGAGLPLNLSHRKGMSKRLRCKYRFALYADGVVPLSHAWSMVSLNGRFVSSFALLLFSAGKKVTKNPAASANWAKMSEIAGSRQTRATRSNSDGSFSCHF